MTMPDDPAIRFASLLERVRACQICEAHLPHGVRPVVQAGSASRIVIIGQAPGSKVHASGVPWDDDSGDRLRGWLGLERESFYDADKVALVPMGFCYPGKGNGGDLPPRPECVPAWHEAVLGSMPGVGLTLLVGQYAQKAYLPPALRKSMTAAVRNIDAMPAGVIALPHPAWRSRLWMTKNLWFEADVLPSLRERVARVLA